VKRNQLLWIVWLLGSVLLGAFLVFGIISDKTVASAGLAASAKQLLLPGATSHGHYQIELACESCHNDPFGGEQVLQKACMNCHGAELKEADDSHPKSKFTDPRNADRIAVKAAWTEAYLTVAGVMKQAAGELAATPAAAVSGTPAGGRFKSFWSSLLGSGRKKTA
jgi:hypothetical protein